MPSRRRAAATSRPLIRTEWRAEGSASQGPSTRLPTDLLAVERDEDVGGRDAIEDSRAGSGAGPGLAARRPGRHVELRSAPARRRAARS